MDAGFGSTQSKLIKWSLLQHEAVTHDINFKKNNNNEEVSKLMEEVSKLKMETKSMKKRVKHLEENQLDINERLGDQKCYTKDQVSLITRNPPFDVRRGGENTKKNIALFLLRKIFG